MNLKTIVFALSCILLLATSCKKDNPLPERVSDVIDGNTTAKQDTGSLNSYYTETFDAYFYLDRFTESSLDTARKPIFETRDRAYCYSFSDTNRNVRVNNFDIKFGQFNIYYDKFLKANEHNLLYLGFLKNPFTFPSSWQLTGIGILPSYTQTISALPDTCSFASLKIDTISAGASFEVILDGPITGADSVLIELKSLMTGRYITKVVQVGKSKYTITAQETSIFHYKDGDAVTIDVLPYKRQRIYIEGKKYLFETARMFQKRVCFK